MQHITEYLNEAKDIADEQMEPRQIKDMAKVLVSLYKAWMTHKTVFICGNGGSASASSHLACDLTKVGLPAYSLCDNGAIMTAVTNDDGFDKLFINQLNNKFSEGDVLFCISVHGGIGHDKAGLWSQNLMQAIDYAQKMGGIVIGLVGNEGGAIRRIANASIKVRNSSTPQVESWHCHMSHLLASLLNAYQPAKMCLSCSLIRKSAEPFCKCGEAKFEYAAGVIGNIAEVEKVIDYKQSPV